MAITQSQLMKIIKEEIVKVVKEASKSNPHKKTEDEHVAASAAVERLQDQLRKAEYKLEKTKDEDEKKSPMSLAKELAKRSFKKIRQETMMGKAGATSEETENE